MLFDLRPKERREDLFDREKELEELHRLTRSEWVVILGRRMTGKTSLMKTFLREVGGVYVNLMGVRSISGFVEALVRAIKVWGVRLELDLKLVRASWTRLAEDVFSRLEGKVVGLDEVQELPANYMLKLLKRVWDSYRVTLVMTGSMMGVLARLLEPDTSSPLFGRTPAVIRLEPFTRNLALEFLETGFRQLGYKPNSRELEEAVDLLDGYPGWLAYYGNFRCIRGYSHRAALDAVVEEGSKVMAEELERFLSHIRNRRLYLDILRRLPATWSELRSELGVNPKVLSEALKRLERAMLITRRGSLYLVPDPLLRAAVTRIKG